MRFAFIDTLRAVAALSVVLFHVLGGNHIPIAYAALPSVLQATVSHANLGVAIFFVLSGFVIAHTLRDEITVGEFGRFMLRRSLRLDPPYWVAIALACAMLYVKYEPMYSASQIAAHMVYMQDLLGVDEISEIFWTLCLELQFYLVFALILLTGSRIVLALAFIASAPLSVIMIWHGLFTQLWYGFLLGAAAYMAWQDRRWAAWFWLYAISLLALAIMRQDPFMGICAATALLLYVMANGDRLGATANWKAFQFLGVVSYSLYLFHTPATGVTFRLGRKLLGDGISAELVTMLTAITLSIFVAWIMWWIVEKPSIAMSRMVSMHRHTKNLWVPTVG